MGFVSHNIYLPIVLLIFVRFYICLSSSIDSITSSKYIKDNETITSNNTEFMLGFFSPENSSNRYLAIWYISQSNIVWIANRDQPVNDSLGVAKIHKDGNFVLMNGQNLMIWSSNVTSSNYSNSSVQLQDSGNLVLYDEISGSILWDSFSHPADAAMPKMKIAANPNTGKKIEYVSWKSPSDPSTGYFTGSLERLNAPEVFFWYNKTKPYWRTGPWNGKVFLGSPRMLTEYLAGWNFHIDDDGTQYLTYNYADPFKFGILSVTPHGTLKLVSFVSKIEVTNFEVGQNECDIYGKCGPFGNCDNSTSPICNCFNGFEPRNSEEWNRKNWTSGCVRKVELQCDKMNKGSEVKQDEFLVYHNMKVPDFTQRSGAYQDKCKIDCLANCSCLAYAYDSGVGCMFWIGDLIDLQHFSYGGIDLYLRTPYSLIERGKKGYKALIGSIIGAIGIITLALCAYLLWRKWAAKQTGYVTAPPRKRPQNTSIEDQNQMKLEELPIFDFERVAAATNNFHLANMLGKGGFGPVYKGVLENGQEIAVKRLSKASTQGLEEFMNEIVVISKLQHRNLVRILGCCIERDEQMLIYEFMPNKSLDAFIFDPIQKKVLNWKKRFNIIEGIARGILYLHRDSRLRIIHRDLKVSNILLDDEMNPKISDFGLARIFKGDEDSEVNTRRVVGTYGYMPPEYAMEGLFSEKSDVYSFGVLLLEIVSGRRNASFYNDEEPLGLVGLAWKLWNEENIMPIIDEEIWEACFENSIVRCIHIGLLCVQEVAKERPTISTVVLMLISEITHLPSPRKVAFVQKQKYSSSTSSQKSQASSNNNLTISEIQAR